MRALHLGMALALIAAPALNSTALADDGQTVSAADKAFAGALAKRDRQAAGALLDDAFGWTDADGAAYGKAQALDRLAALAAETKGETDVETHFYGALGTVRGSHDGKRFLRVWAKRPDGWRAYLLIDTPVAPRTGQASVEAAAGAGDCDNPCRTVPYAPKTAMDKMILDTWQKTKMIEWKPNAEEWARYVGDEFMIINNTTIRNKPERVAIARKQQEAGAGAPGDPILDMEIHDFGDNAAVMVSHHFPYRGGKPYRNVRVWVLRDGGWQLAISQQSTIQSEAPHAAVAAK